MAARSTSAPLTHPDVLPSSPAAFEALKQAYGPPQASKTKPAAPHEAPRVEKEEEVEAKQQAKASAVFYAPWRIKGWADEALGFAHKVCVMLDVTEPTALKQTDLTPGEMIRRATELLVAAVKNGRRRLLHNPAAFELYYAARWRIQRFRAAR